MPCLTALAATSGLAIAASTALDSVSSTGAGVLAGANSASHASASPPATPCSFSSGTSGSCGALLSEAIASARMSPDWISPSTDGSVEKATSMRPPTISRAIGPAPRNATCTMSVPVLALNSSMARCEAEPAPVEP